MTSDERASSHRPSSPLAPCRATGSHPRALADRTDADRAPLPAFDRRGACPSPAFLWQPQAADRGHGLRARSSSGSSSGGSRRSSPTATPSSSRRLSGSSWLRQRCELSRWLPPCWDAAGQRRRATRISPIVANRSRFSGAHQGAARLGRQRAVKHRRGARPGARRAVGQHRRLLTGCPWESLWEVAGLAALLPFVFSGSLRSALAEARSAAFPGPPGHSSSPRSP